ncbi:MAG: hypothetical protein ABI898_10710 [Sphingomonadales bacterium]
MRQTIVAIFSALALLMTGACGENEGTTYEAPVSQVYDKLANLDLGADIGSATFMYHDSSMPSAVEQNKSVSWHMGGKRGSDIIATLTPVSDTQTKVVIDVNIPQENVASMPLPLQNMAKNMIRERIAAHLEERPFNDQKFMDAMYGGAGSLVPQNIRDAGMNAQRQHAQMQRDIAEMEKESAGSSTSTQSQRPLKWGEPVTTGR